MKKCIVFFFLLLSLAPCFAIKGLYVDGFAGILGNANKEDSLLNYAQQNGFTYLALYQLHVVNASHDLTTVPTSVPLATFISKAKTLYGVQQVGACGENAGFFTNVISIYNSIHPNPAEKIDVYNLEFEFWNTGSVGPGQYYCTTYLTPGGYSCDTSGAFAFYMQQLNSIDSLALADGTTSEIYVGWFNAYQAQQMAAVADRVLLHSYVTNVNNVYSYAQTRLSYLGSGNDTIHVLPIFSSEPAFLGPWLSTNPETGAYNLYATEFASDTGSWKAHINLLGYQWFDYTDMPYGLPAGLEEVQADIRVYPNPFTHSFQMELNNALLKNIRLYHISGDCVFEASTHYSVIQCMPHTLPPGIYYLVVEMEGTTITRKLVKQ